MMATMKQKPPPPTLNSKLAAKGARLALARHFGISKQAVSRWPVVPTARVKAVATFLRLAQRDVRGVPIERFPR